MTEVGESITPKEARQRLLLAYKQRNPRSLVEFVKRPLLNPIEQRNAKNKRKLHPLLIVGAVLSAFAVVALSLFSH